MTNEEPQNGEGEKRTIRHGFGVFDCPMPNCHEAIIGSYTDLLNHVQKHPYSKNVVDEEGQSIRERVREARSEALTRDIQERMVVSKQNKHTQTDCHEANEDNS